LSRYRTQKSTQRPGLATVLQGGDLSGREL
jgi:hypothetical protein